MSNDLPNLRFCNGFIYGGGRISPVPSLGIDGTVATGINDRGQIAGYYLDNLHNQHGFLYSDVLEAFAQKIKPIVKQKIGYDVIDVRDVSRAGIIDNIMRAQIRDFAFVLADLTHDNSGAYWEAGYAEGWGSR